MKKIIVLLFLTTSPLIQTHGIYNSTSENQQLVTISQEEAQEILASTKDHVYFGPEVCTIIQELPALHQQMRAQEYPCTAVSTLCNHIMHGKKSSPVDMMHAALYEAYAYLTTASYDTLSQEKAEELATDLEEYYKKIETGDVLIMLESLAYDDELLQTRACKFLIKGCQPGPIRFGTSDQTSLTLVTSCLDRIVIDGFGAVSVALPSNLDNALTVTGNIVVPAADATGTLGIIKLGGAGTNRVNMYEIGVHNLFIGNGAVNFIVTGTNNISIGTTANSSLTSANNTIAIGSLAQATGTDSIVIGDMASTATTRAIVIGSRDSTSTGAAPTASSTNAIAIGSGSGANAGAISSGTSSIAIGAAGPVFGGAQASGDRSIAIGLSATSTITGCISLGSASGTAGGSGPRAANMNAIAIGSASNVNAGANAQGIASIAIGSADLLPTITGAQATGDRSIAIGITAVAGGAGTIAIGSAYGAASGTTGGVGPIANNISAIAIGSGNINRNGALATGIAAIAIGGADDNGSGTVSNGPGAIASGDRTIALGINARATAAQSIAIGGIGTAIGTSAITTGTGAIAIGCGVGATNGASASGLAAIAIGTAGTNASGSQSIAIGVGATATGISAIAIGSTPGASATGDRSVAIGTGASTAQADAILLGNAATTAVKVGIGVAAPAAKLHVVGVNGTSVFRFDQVVGGVGTGANAPVWLNPTTAAVAATPIHYNATNQLFGFTSSQRYKTNIRSIDTESEIIYQLNPVIYDPIEGGDAKDIPGFIAEEVYEIAPHLAILNGDNQPENVAYNSLHALAIKEIQKQQQRIEEQSIIINEQGEMITMLLAALEQLEAQMSLLENAQVLS